MMNSLIKSFDNMKNGMADTIPRINSIQLPSEWLMKPWSYSAFVNDW